MLVIGRDTLKAKIKVAMLPGYDGTMELAVNLVDDPYERGAKLAVVKNVRTDILSKLHGEGHIDDCQWKSGQRFLGLMEAAGVCGARAGDWTREVVDGTPDPSGAILGHIHAMDQLSATRKHLGRTDYDLVYGILGKIFTISQVGFLPRGQVDSRYVGRRFRDALESLGQFWGYVS